jgi:spore coat protein CotH
MRALFLPFLAFSGCGPVTLDPGTVEDSTPDVPPDTSADSGSQDGADTGVEEVGGVDDFAAWVYDQSIVHTLEIELSDQAFEELYLYSEAYESSHWVEGNIVYDGERVDSVGVRLKGRWGSWRSVYQKAAFKIDFNHYVDGQVFYGLKGLTLNNMVIDYSYLREHLAYKVYEAMGVPSPRNAYTWVTVNGEAFGLYMNVETADDVYLSRFYDDSDGNLYDADYIRWPDGSYSVLDFYTSLAPLFEQEEGEDTSGDDLMALSQMLDETVGSAEVYQTSADWIDWDHHHRMMAAEMWTGQIDGYSLNQNNYLVYFDPSDGRMDVLPWDHDYAFLHASDWGFSWYWPRGRLSGLCVADTDCQAHLKDQVREVISQVESLDLMTQLEETRAMILPYVEADPRKEAGMDYTIWYQNVLREWIMVRNAELEEMWGL